MNVMDAQRRNKSQQPRINKHIIHHSFGIGLHAKISYRMSTTFWYTFTLCILISALCAMHGYHIKTGKTLIQTHIHEISISHLINDHLNRPVRFILRHFFLLASELISTEWICSFFTVGKSSWVRFQFSIFSSSSFWYNLIHSLIHFLSTADTHIQKELKIWGTTRVNINDRLWVILNKKSAKENMSKNQNQKKEKIKRQIQPIV